MFDTPVFLQIQARFKQALGILRYLPKYLGTDGDKLFSY